MTAPRVSIFAIIRWSLSCQHRSRMVSIGYCFVFTLVTFHYTSRFIDERPGIDMSDPATSIVMCTYNGSRHVLQQMESFARQSLLPEELIVCDDVSKDDTVEI